MGTGRLGMGFDESRERRRVRDRGWGVWEQGDRESVGLGMGTVSGNGGGDSGVGTRGY
jgi:hypothetical protein